MPEKTSRHEKDDHALFRTRRRADGSLSMEAHTPGRVLKIHSREELQAQLEWYATGLLSHRLPDTKSARRRYVELIRPALRYYCAKYDVTVPSWLKDDSYYKEHMSATTREKQFGAKPLRIGEFKKLVSKPRGRHNPGGGGATK